MDGDVTVPITWLFYIGALLISVFIWWIRAEFNRNWKEHDAMRTTVGETHKRIDHIILNTPNMPAYVEK